MRYQTLFFLFAFLVFISCSKKKDSLELPISQGISLLLKEQENSNFKSSYFTVYKTNEDEFKIIFKDSIATIIDSTLHRKIYDIAEKHTSYHEYAYTTVFVLDRLTSFNQFNNLIKEFQKANFQRFYIKLEDGSYLKYNPFPYFPNEKDYIDHKYKGMGAPLSSIDFEYYQDLYKEQKIISFIKENDAIKMFNSSGNEILNFQNFAFMNKKFFMTYEIEANQTLQDFVDVISKCLKLTNELHDLNQEKYSVILIENNYLKELLKN